MANESFTNELRDMFRLIEDAAATEAEEAAGRAKTALSATIERRLKARGAAFDDVHRHFVVLTRSNEQMYVKVDDLAEEILEAAHEEELDAID